MNTHITRRPRKLVLSTLLGALTMLLALTACAQSGSSTSNAEAPAPATSGNTNAGQAMAVFAGGCFWCMQPPFDKLVGVISTQPGYIGGRTANPTYEQVSAGGTGHTEGVRVVYDPSKVSYPQLLEVFWHNIDPVAVDRQFCDRGDQYRSAIFPLDAEQRAQAESSKRAFEKDPRFTQPIATRVEPEAVFYPAEDYHQDYYKKNPLRYKYYRNGCRRDQRLEEIWGKPD